MSVVLLFQIFFFFWLVVSNSLPLFWVKTGLESHPSSPVCQILKRGIDQSPLAVILSVFSSPSSAPQRRYHTVTIFPRTQGSSSSSSSSSSSRTAVRGRRGLFAKHPSWSATLGRSVAPAGWLCAVYRSCCSNSTAWCRPHRHRQRLMLEINTW